MPVCIHGRKERRVIKKTGRDGGSISTRACHFNLCEALSKPLQCRRGVSMYVGQKDAIFYHEKHRWSSDAMPAGVYCSGLLKNNCDDGCNKNKQTSVQQFH